MRYVNFHYSVLNITMHPHSPELYLELFKEAFPKNNQPGHYFGNDFISLQLGIKESCNGVEYLPGIIVKYTKIKDQDWFDVENGQVLKDAERPNLDIERFCPNTIQLDFIFIPDGHRLFFIYKHQRERLSQAYFARALQSIFAADHIRLKYGDIAVTVEMDDSGMEAIHRLDSLERLTVRVTLPNSDDLSPEKASFVRRMESQGIARVDETLKALDKRGIKPDAKTKALMELAQSNGFVVATGMEGGKRVTRKSSDFPFSDSEKYNQDGEIPRDGLLRKALEKIHTFVHRQNK